MALEYVSEQFRVHTDWTIHEANAIQKLCSWTLIAPSNKSTIARHLASRRDRPRYCWLHVQNHNQKPNRLVSTFRWCHLFSLLLRKASLTRKMCLLQWPFQWTPVRLLTLFDWVLVYIVKQQFQGILPRYQNMAHGGKPYFLFGYVLIERLSITLRQTANGKNETFAYCLQLSVQYSENIYLWCIVGDIRPFLCDLFKDYKKEIKNQRYSLPFAVCLLRHA